MRIWHSCVHIWVMRSKRGVRMRLAHQIVRLEIGVGVDCRSSASKMRRRSKGRGGRST